MNRRDFNRTVAGAVAAGASWLPGRAQKQDGRPNIVFVPTDDQRLDSLGCYGNSLIHTPHIDRLAADGVLFEQATVTSAICTPSRACYFLGQYERRHGINFNSGTSMAPSVWEDSYPMLLRNAGYFTGYVGKNHVPIGARGYETGIIEKSFDFWYGAHGHLTFYPKTRSDIFRAAKADTQPEVLREGALSFLNSHNAFIEGATAFLKQRPGDRPFCLSVCFNLPHAAGTSTMKMLPSDPELYRTAYRDQNRTLPLPANYMPRANIQTLRIPRNVLYAQYRQKSYDYVDTEDALRERLVRQYQTITGIDGVVGAIRTELKKLGLERKTVIVFASDHGIMAGEFGLGGKALNYDACLRIPMLVMDPRLPQAVRGHRLSELVQSIDVAPTLIDLAGLPKCSTMQGRSMAPLVRGERTAWRDHAFSENLWSTVFGNPRVESVRSSEWKFIRYFATERSLFGAAGENREAYGVTPQQRQAYENWLTASVRGLKPDYEELFHVAADPNETINLATDSSHAGVLASLRKQCDGLVRGAKGNLNTPPATVPLPAGASPVAAD